MNDDRIVILLKIKIRAEPQTKGGDPRMVEVGKPFYEVQPEDGKDIVNADAGFRIRFPAERIRGGHLVSLREFHLAGIDRGIVLTLQPAVEDFGRDDFS